MNYPTVRRAVYSYVKHGITIPDPYHYLEDPQAKETQAFAEAQKTYCDDYIKSYDKHSELMSSISKMQDFGRHTAFSKRGKYFYYYHNSGLQNQSVYYRTPDLDADVKPEIFLDPNTFSEDGTSAISATSWSKSQSLFAYSISEKGSDWSKASVKNAETGEILPDKIDWLKYTDIAWLEDKGFFYSRLPATLPEEHDKGTETEVASNHMIYYHTIGTKQEDDIKVLEMPENPTWLLGAEVSDCHKYVIVSVMDGCEPKNLLWIASLPNNFPESHDLQFVKVVNEWVGQYECIGNDDTKFYFTTTTGSPKKRVISIDISNGCTNTVVQEAASPLDFCCLVGDQLLLCYLEDVKHVLYIRGLAADSPLIDVSLPIGSVESLSARREQPLISLKVTSFTFPGRVYKLPISDPKALSVWREDNVAGFNSDEFVIKQVFYDSGRAKIPMFLVHHKSTDVTKGDCPTLLYAYGGFNISITPSFSPSRIVFLRDYGGLLAVANIRGGGEYGEEWHKAGMREEKQNCFTDFINGAKFLIDGHYTKSDRLCIMGGSNGGLLVGAALNQAPELFGAAVAQVGVMDILRFHLFTIGHAWKSDFGDPEVQKDFQTALKYSPIHNIRSNAPYPPILCTTGDHDDRVVPLHTYKYIASMQHTNPEGGPFIARVELSAGHGAGKSTMKRVEESADTYAFIAKALNIPKLA